ncbi:MAG: hypothetical protein QOE80_1748, partial [Actinomycetota bacterium]|nr:hypothetical protein [Actinomycetota bacterium]
MPLAYGNETCGLRPAQSDSYSSTVRNAMDDHA